MKMPARQVGLIFAELGHLTGVFNNEVHAGMVIGIMLTTLLAPIWMKLYYQYFEPLVTGSDDLWRNRVQA